ncbi:MAG TPA: alkene reductase [Schlesneria sp.]|jgi:N-ethylmaleimide reductase
MMDGALAGNLFAPTTIGVLSVPNRIVMAPLTRARADLQGVHTPLAADYYSQRCSAGLMISETTNISRHGTCSAFSPGIYTDAQIAAWKIVTDAVHASFGRIFVQLSHAGRFSHVSLQDAGEVPAGPSAIPAGGQIWIESGYTAPSEPRALSLAEITEVVLDFRKASMNAKLAGFDGVEIHAANCYLLDQFVRDSTNRRIDHYGGSLDNRTRLPYEVAEAVVGVFGANRVGIRLSPLTTAMGDTPLDSAPQTTYEYLCERLGGLGLAYLHCIEGQTRGSNKAHEFDFQALRNRCGSRYIANNGYDYELASRTIAKGQADMVSFARLFISNPDLVERFRQSLPLVEAPKESYYGRGSRGYTDWM